MASAARFHLTVILPFGDDEDVLGGTVRRLASFLRAQSITFELLAVDEDSGDNSHAVLAILRPEVPELRVTHAPTRGRGVEVGAARAQGQVIAIIGAGLPEAELGGLWASVQRIGDGAAEIEFATGSFIVANRVRSLDDFAGARLNGEASQRRLARRLAARGRAVLLDGISLTAAVPPERPASRKTWRDAFTTRRAS